MAIGEEADSICSSPSKDRNTHKPPTAIADFYITSKKFLLPLFPVLEKKAQHQATVRVTAHLGTLSLGIPSWC